MPGRKKSQHNSVGYSSSFPSSYCASSKVNIWQLWTDRQGKKEGPKWKPLRHPGLQMSSDGWMVANPGKETATSLDSWAPSLRQSVSQLRRSSCRSGAICRKSKRGRVPCAPKALPSRERPRAQKADFKFVQWRRPKLTTMGPGQGPKVVQRRLSVKVANSYPEPKGANKWGSDGPSFRRGTKPTT